MSDQDIWRGDQIEVRRHGKKIVIREKEMVKDGKN